MLGSNMPRVDLHLNVKKTVLLPYSRIPREPHGEGSPLFLCACTGKVNQGPGWQEPSRAPNQTNLFRDSVRSKMPSTQISVLKWLAPIPPGVTVFGEKDLSNQVLGDIPSP